MWPANHLAFPGIQQTTLCNSIFCFGLQCHQASHKDRLGPGTLCVCLIFDLRSRHPKVSADVGLQSCSSQLQSTRAPSGTFSVVPSTASIPPSCSNCTSSATGVCLVPSGANMRMVPSHVSQQNLAASWKAFLLKSQDLLTVLLVVCLSQRVVSLSWGHNDNNKGH